MPVGEKARRLLWSRSGGRCSFCGERVVGDALPGDASALGGEECHIVSSTSGGPRHDPAFPRAGIDEATNLILLCAPHHRLVHERPIEYSSAALHLMKARHERRVEREVERAIGERRRPNFARLTSGSQTLAVVLGAAGLDLANDKPGSAEEAEAIDAFFDGVRRCGALGEALPEGKRLQLAVQWTREIETLEAAGFVVYGARLERPNRPGQGRPPRLAVIRVLRVINVLR